MVPAAVECLKEQFTQKWKFHVLETEETELYLF